jgi:AcrR family transcriptional regulator
LNTKDRIIDMALRLFNDMGTSAISTNHIADALEMSPGNLYYHFHNKEEIIRAILERMLEMRKEVYALPADRPRTLADLQRMVQGNFSLLWDYRFFYRELNALMQKDAVLKERYQAIRWQGLAHFETLFHRFVAAGVLRMPADSASISDLARICWLISDYWLPFVELDDGFTVTEHMQQGIHLVMQALRPYASEAALSELALSDTAVHDRQADTVEPKSISSPQR